MKLLRYGEIGKEKPGILDQDGKIRDLSNHISDINGDNISKESLNKISSIDVSSLPIIPENTRLGACVGNIGKFLCIGLNYSITLQKLECLYQVNQYYFQRQHLL